MRPNTADYPILPIESINKRRSLSRNALPVKQRLKLMKLVADVDKVRKLMEPTLSDVGKAL